MRLPIGSALNRDGLRKTVRLIIPGVLVLLLLGPAFEFARRANELAQSAVSLESGLVGRAAATCDPSRLVDADRVRARQFRSGACDPVERWSGDRSALTLSNRQRIGLNRQVGRPDGYGSSATFEVPCWDLVRDQDGNVESDPLSDFGGKFGVDTYELRQACGLARETRSAAVAVGIGALLGALSAIVVVRRMREFEFLARRI